MWPNGADCKSAGLRLRWFESNPAHFTQRFFLPPLLRARAAFFAGFFVDFVLLFAFDLARRDAPAFDFPRFADLPFVEPRRDDLAFELLPPFFVARLAPLFFGAAFAPAFLTAFRTLGVTELLAPAARPAIAPMAPPTTAPTGPATLPRTAPAAMPAVCFEMGGIWMFSDDEPDVSVDGGFSSGIHVLRMAAALQPWPV